MNVWIAFIWYFQFCLKQEMLLVKSWKKFHFKILKVKLKKIFTQSNPTLKKWLVRVRQRLTNLYKALFPNLFSTVPLSPRSNLSITLLQEGKTRCDQFSVNHLNILLQWCLKVFFKIPTLFISDLTDLKTFFWPIWIIGSLKKLKLGNFLI